MTEQQVKEQLSLHYIGLVSSKEGFKYTSFPQDHGVDIHVTRTFMQTRDGKIRYVDSGEYVDIQAKCTCESQIIPSETGIKYDLEAKTYNDLVSRKEYNNITPLILVLLVLPDDVNEWLQISPENLILRRRAYWYKPEDGAQLTHNDSTTRIHISHTNIVGLNFMSARFAEAYS